MNKQKSLRPLLPMLVIFIFVGFLWWELFHHKENELPSALIGQNVPEFSMPDVHRPDKAFTQKNLLGQVTLLNVWATWCYACRVEHPMLMLIQNQYQVPIYSIDYKDQPDAAKRWLAELGNPYVLTGDDSKGDVAIDFGVYGTPETYLIDKRGQVRYRHIGALDQETWEKVLWPLVQEYRKEKI